MIGFVIVRLGVCAIISKLQPYLNLRRMNCRIRLTASEAVASLLVLNVTADVSSDIDVDGAGQQSEVKIKAAKFVKQIQELQITAWMALLIEEAMAGRELVVDFVLDSLVESFKTSLAMDDVYVLSSLCLFLPELERTKSGSIAKLLTSLLDIIESVVLDEAVLVVLVSLAADILVYCAYLIDTSIFFNRFQAAVNRWMLDTDECNFQQMTIQKLRFVVIYLSCNYLRYPFPRVGFPVVEAKGALFGTPKNHVMKINNETIVSALPVGRYAWRFKSVAPDCVPRTLSDDINITDEVRPVTEHAQQSEFSSKLSNYFQDLYENQLKDFDVEAELCNPGDFDAKNSVKLTANTACQAFPQLVPPSTVGAPAVSFASSLNFFDILESPRFSAVIPEERDDIDHRTFASTTLYRHQIHASILRDAGETDLHFEDFAAGLGLVPPSEQAVVHVDCHHEVIFHVDGDYEVLIVWTNGLSRETLIQSYNEKNYMRIEISPRSSGLYTVEVKIVGSKAADFMSFSPLVVTKRALPVAVLSQVLINVHVLDRKMGKIQSPFLVNGALLSAVRDTSFAPHSVTLLSPKTIYDAV